MTVNTVSWEQYLLQRAYDALDDHKPATGVVADTELLDQAYHHCTEVTQFHSRTFHMASGLLPGPQKQAVRALYAFCRVSDDIVDRNTDGRLQKLDAWRQASLSAHPATKDPVALAWTDTRTQYDIPRLYAQQLLDGVAQDLTQTRYETFADLAHYCYGVASTVGLMTMHIVGFSGKEAIPYAIKLGVALQLTNILRDVAEDWENGRLYLPLEELHLFGLSEEDIAAGRVDDRWHAFMDFQIARTRQLYEEALPGIALLGRQGRFAIAAAAELYRGILDDIEAHNHDVFSRRAYTTKWQKLIKLPGIWWRAIYGGYSPPSQPSTDREAVFIVGDEPMTA